MHHRFDTILRRLRQDLAHHLDPHAIHAACRQAGHTWRACVLDPVAIVHWFLLQVLHGNTSLEHVARLSGGRFTGAAYCLARAGLPRAVLQHVLAHLIHGVIPQTQAAGLWRGHRTLLVDGSSVSMPDTAELQHQFGQPGVQAPGCGFPVAKLLALFDAGTGLVLKVLVTPLRTHEMAGVGSIQPTLQPGDVLVGDRGFCSFGHLAQLTRGGIHAVVRLHQRQLVDFTPGRPHTPPAAPRGAAGQPRSRWLRHLGAGDQVVEYHKPAACPDTLTPQQYATLPATLVVRELRYEVAHRGFRTRTVTLVTTLLDAAAYPRDAVAELYGRRWEVEQNLRHLKTTMKMDVLKCKTVEGVLKELTVFAIVYNLVRIVMGAAARRQGVAVERISFVDALRWLAEPGDAAALPPLVVNRRRPGRCEPRVRKRRPKQYRLMRKPRSVLRNELLGPEVTA